MTTVTAKHAPYRDGHLGLVLDEMLLTGAPTIRVVEGAGRIYAVEGSHRLWCCHHLGLIPKIIVLEPDFPGIAVRASWDQPAYEFPHVLALEESAFMNQPPKVICDHCSKQLNDEVTVTSVEWEEAGPGEVALTVRCHGQQQTMTLLDQGTEIHAFKPGEPTQPADEGGDADN